MYKEVKGDENNMMKISERYKYSLTLGEAGNIKLQN